MTYAQVASTVRQQLGVFGLGVVGASDLGLPSWEGPPGLTFRARLHFTNQTRVRIMRVNVTLNGADAYDIDVIRPNGSEFRFAESVHSVSLAALMYRLDSEGVPQ